MRFFFRSGAHFFAAAPSGCLQREERLAQTDDELVALTLSGSLDSFDTLMVRYQRLVFRIAFNYCREREQAMDTTQNVFLKAYQSLGYLRRGQDFKAWVIRIAYNESSDSWRRSHGNQELDDETLAGVAAGAVSPEQGLLLGERKRLLARKLTKLNPRHRLALILKYLEGWSIVDIACAMGCSESVVKNMLYRGVRRLAHAVGNEEAAGA